MTVETIQIPDLGSDDAVEVIEILVKVGDCLTAHDNVAVLESDKAAMEIPCSAEGVVKKILIKVGDQVKSGMPLLELELSGVIEVETPEQPAKTEAKQSPFEEPRPERQDEETKSSSSIQQVLLPDLGTSDEVEVIEILVSEGELITAESGLVTLETDKAAMDVPASVGGKLVKLYLKVGEKVKTGQHVADIEVTDIVRQDSTEASEQVTTRHENKAGVLETSIVPAPDDLLTIDPASQEEVYAGPAVRKLARELGVDLRQVTGSGSRQRIQKEDVHEFVKGFLQSTPVTPLIVGVGGLPQVEDIDFGRFGSVAEVELTKLQRVTAQNMTKSWLNVPRVTQFDEADITELENFRAEQKVLADNRGIKLSPLPFIVKASALTLREYPQFNVSIHSSGLKLIQKNYVHIGVAVATPTGLMVPVIRDADKLTVWEIAEKIQQLAARAKDRKLSREDMEGACFTVSSLGSMGGLGFTPIINTPEVAILGVSRATVKPVWNGKDFMPRTMLPYSLAYDHRAVNGIDGGMFATHLGKLLSDIRLMLL